MAGKIKVYGKAQNRTALGIAHAYAVMHPYANLESLRREFPNSLNPDMGVSELFLPVEEALTFNTKMSLYFTKEDEVITLADGSQVALAQVWTKPSFERMVEQGKLYDIEVAEFEKTMKGARGGYRLEYLNGYVPPVPEEKKKSKTWLWILLLLLLAAAGVAAYLLTRKPEVVEVEKEKVVEVEKVVEKTVIVHDTITVYAERIAEIIS